MVQRRPGGDQLTHYAVVPQMRGRNQLGAIVAASHQFGAGAIGQQDAQVFLVIGTAAMVTAS